MVVVADEFVGELWYWLAHEAFVNDGCEQAVAFPVDMNAVF